MSPPLARSRDGDGDVVVSGQGDGLGAGSGGAADCSDETARVNHFLPPIRPPIAEHTSDPNPVSPRPVTSAPPGGALDSAITGNAHGAGDKGRPPIKTAQSTPGATSDTEPPGAQEVLKVLVVEDNPVNRKIMCTMLKRAVSDSPFCSECLQVIPGRTRCD